MKCGDVVRLNGEFKNMTVINNIAGMVTCVWFNWFNLPQISIFPESALHEVPRPIE